MAHRHDWRAAVTLRRCPSSPNKKEFRKFTIVVDSTSTTMKSVGLDLLGVGARAVDLAGHLLNSLRSE